MTDVYTGDTSPSLGITCSPRELSNTTGRHAGQVEEGGVILLGFLTSRMTHDPPMGLFRGKPSTGWFKVPKMVLYIAGVAILYQGFCR